jgi:hypothetical protein
MDRNEKFPVGFIGSDYDGLDKVINSKKVYKLADVQNKVEKVAFDVVRFVDSEDLDKLWIIKDNGGEKVLVAMYDDDAPEINKAASVKWAAVSDQYGNVNVFYKGETITKLAVEKFGLNKDDAKSVCRFLPQKLANDKAFSASLLNQLSDSEKASLYTKYPELKG